MRSALTYRNQPLLCASVSANSGLHTRLPAFLLFTYFVRALRKKERLNPLNDYMFLKIMGEKR
jgi:hypothetical protein